eukprot:2513746-Prymnesium_polylepis.1
MCIRDRAYLGGSPECFCCKRPSPCACPAAHPSWWASTSNAPGTLRAKSPAWRERFYHVATPRSTP